MNPISIGLADWRMPASGPEAIRLAAHLGVEGIQLDLGGPCRAPWLDSPARLQSIRDVLDETGVKPLAVSANLLNDVGLTAEKGTRAAEQVCHIILRALDVATKLGVDLVFLPSFRRSSIESTSALTRTAEILQWSCSEASARGLLLATENVLEPERLQQLITSVDSSRLRVVLDTGNPLVAGVSPISIVRCAASVLAAQVHIKGVDDKKPLSNREGVVLDTINELRRRNISLDAFVLENDYRDGVVERLQTDILWLRNYITHF